MSSNGAETPPGRAGVAGGPPAARLVDAPVVELHPRRDPCAGKTGLFFAGDRESIDIAKAICATCPREAECLSEAMTRREVFGVWGGTDPRDRKLLRRLEGAA